MSDIDLQYELMSEGRMNLMHLPPGAIAWLWDRPQKQIQAAEDLAVAANAHGNPVADASLLKADQNILLIKCEGGECFRVYPDGGYSYDEAPMDIGGCSSVLQGGGDCGCPMDDNGHQMPPEMDDMMGGMMDGMVEDEGDSGDRQTYWLYYGDRVVGAIRLPAGASDRDVKMRALHQYHQNPKLWDENVTPGLIHHSEIRMHEGLGNDEHMDTRPPESGVAVPQGMTNMAGEPTMDEDQGGDWGGPGASTMGGMGTGTPYVGDIDMSSYGDDEDIDPVGFTRECQGYEDDELDEMAKALGVDGMLVEMTRQEMLDKYGDDRESAPTPPDHVNLEVYDAATDQMKDVLVGLNWDIQPTEYDGPFVSYQGGAVLDHMKLAQPVEVNGEVFTNLSEKLAALILQDLMDFEPGQAWETLRNYVEESEGKDIHVPTMRYPDSRGL